MSQATFLNITHYFLLIIIISLIFPLFEDIIYYFRRGICLEQLRFIVCLSQHIVEWIESCNELTISWIGDFESRSNVRQLIAERNLAKNRFIYNRREDSLDALSCLNFVPIFTSLVGPCWLQKSLHEVNIMYLPIPNRSSHNKWSITHSTLMRNFYLRKCIFFTDFLWFTFLQLFLLTIWVSLFVFGFMGIFLMLLSWLLSACLNVKSYLFSTVNSHRMEIVWFTVSALINVRVFRNWLMALFGSLLYADEKPYIEIDCEWKHWFNVLLLTICNFRDHSQNYSQGHLYVI